MCVCVVWDAVWRVICVFKGLNELMTDGCTVCVCVCGWLCVLCVDDWLCERDVLFKGLHTLGNDGAAEIW